MKAISEYKNNLKKAELQIQYQRVNAPVDGIVFDMKISKNGVTNAGKTLLTLIPQRGLKAKVNISNSDIGAITKGQKARIRVDAYPFTNYGEINGTVTSMVQMHTTRRRAKLL